MPYEKIYKNKFYYDKNNNVNQTLTNYLLIYNSNSIPLDIYIAHQKIKFNLIGHLLTQIIILYLII